MKSKILIVDDDLERLKSLNAFLKDAEYAVETADLSEIDAGNFQEVPDLLIAAPHFENGESLSRTIRARAEWRTVPILLIGTLPANDAAIIEELDDGANEYLRLPYQTIRLATIVAKLIERERMGKIVRQRDYRFLSLIENSTDLITVMSLDGVIYYESPSAKRILGREPHTGQGFNIFDFIHPRDRRRVAAYICKAVPNPPLSAFVEYRYRHQDGSWCNLESVGRLVEDPSKGTVLVVNSRDVTRRKKSETALRQSEKKFRAQYKNIPLPTYTWQKKGDDFVFCDFNEAADKITERKIKSLLGMKASEIYSHSPSIVESLNRCFNERKTVNQKILYTYRTTGATRYLDIDFVYVPPDLIMAHAQDVTDILRSAESLAASENRFKLAARATNDALWDWDVKKDEIWLNDGFFEMSGYPRDIKKPGIEFWTSNLHAEDRDRVLEGFDDFIRSGESYFSAEYRFRRHDGSFADIYDRSYALRTEDGSLMRMIGAMMDVTERKKVENAVRFQALLLDTVQQAVIATDLNGKIIYWNGYAEKIYGWREAETRNRQLADLILPEVKHSESLKAMAALRNGGNWTGEMLLRRHDGTLFPAQITTSPVHNEQGERIGVLGISTDITERRLAEEKTVQLNAEIKNQREHLNAIISSIPGIVWESSLTSDYADQTVNFVSDYVEKIVGYTVEEWLREPDFWLQIMHPEDREHTLLAIKSYIEKGEKFVQQYRWIAKDKSVIWVETQMVLDKDRNGRPVRVRGISIDISQRKFMEEALQKSTEQLRQSQKLESVGRLAGGIAHDFNNMLTAINGYSDLILRELFDNDSLRRKVLEIKKAGERSAALTHQLLAFSRRQVLQPKLIDLNKTVGEMSELFRRLIGEDIQLDIALSHNPSFVEADPSQLSQVIMNLVVNARDAMPNGGKLTVKTEKVLFQEQPVVRFAPENSGTFIKLSVVDTGIGMNDKIIEQIFEPFFTTKQAGAGTGLGLSTAYGIVKQSGGYILVDSDIGKGADFKVYLPYVEEKIAASKEKRRIEPFPHGTETILLVEDEELVRNLTSRILIVCGYKVIEAKNGIDALKICRRNDCQIDLLMTDVVMPQMDGRELSEKVVALNPSVRTLFTSGYTNDRVIRLGFSGDAANFIQKPFAPDVLARKVREILDQEEAKNLPSS